ncbi:hypothetical protein EOD41_19585 [Mucilaginibacter limnophilus]|uniref:Hybrid sensor histidine kinase/response regulator n=1 Tax=Mucilaginibacter limnophilus TaxID=1932778 RepID=A0A437MHX2_9SPHI|nr:hypothetical protein EOD41_19585 [Mucilaginibacter limnophilus]
MKYFRSLLSFFCCNLVLVLSAYSQKYLFRHYQSDDGLSYNSVNCMIQDKNGFIWFGTEDGLSRFDGKSFKNFGSQHSEFSIGNNFISSLHQDKNGTIWAGTHNGLWHYDA